MFCFLKTDIREQKKYEKRIQTSVDSAINELCQVRKYLECSKHCFSFLNENILFLERYFLRFLRIKFLAFSCGGRYWKTCLGKNLECYTGKLTDWIIKYDHVIKCVLFFCVLFLIRTHFIRTLMLRLHRKYEFRNNDQVGCKDPKKIQGWETDQINWNLTQMSHEWTACKSSEETLKQNKVYAIKIFSWNTVCGSVSKENVIYTNLSIKV